MRDHVIPAGADEGAHHRWVGWREALARDRDPRARGPLADLGGRARELGIDHDDRIHIDRRGLELGNDLDRTQRRANEALQRTLRTAFRMDDDQLVAGATWVTA